MPHHLSGLTNSLRQLGEIRVNDWDFHGLMHTELKDLEIGRALRRLGNKKVMEWDFRAAFHREEPIGDLSDRLENFLRYLVAGLAAQPGHAHLAVEEISPRVLRFRLVVTKKDQALLVGKRGATAAAIRGILKSTAADAGAHALLEIATREEETARCFRESRS